MPEAAPPDLTSSATDGQDEGDNTQQDTTTQPEPTETKPTETVDFWKSKAREQERRAKANADAANRLAELENSKKTDQQKLEEQLAEAKRAQAEAERSLLRAKVAGAKGLSPTLASRLNGETEDEIEADADALLAELKTVGAPAKADLKQGNRGKDTDANDVDAWIRRAAGRT